MSVNTFDHLHELADRIKDKKALIPYCKEYNDEITYPYINRYNLNFAGYLQPFGEQYARHTFELSRDNEAFGRLGPIMLSDIIKDTKEKDFKAYFCDFCQKNESVIHTRNDREKNNTYTIERNINTWIDKCGIEKSNPDVNFSRCVLICFVTDFMMDGESEQRTAGHCITLGLELKNKIMRLKIYDYRMHEYMYNVHDHIFQWMMNAVQKYNSYFHYIHTEMVCLKGKLHVDGEFMTCVSAAFRVCIFLSRREQIHETDDQFIMNKFNLQEHLFRMFNWVKKENNIEKFKSTLLVSPAMTENVFEINKQNCYLILAPYKVHNDHKDPSVMGYIKAIDRDNPHVTYSIEKGFVISNGDKQ